MVDGLTTTATATTTTMLNTTAKTTTYITTSTASSDMAEYSLRDRTFHEHHSFNNVDSADDGMSDERTDPHSSNTEDSDEDFDFTSKDKSTIRLPSGKTISRKANGPPTLKPRHRRTPSPTTRSHVQTSRKVHGNCAMIPNNIEVKTSTPPQTMKRASPPPTRHSTSGSDSKPETTSISDHQSSSNSLAPHLPLQTHRTTIRSSDVQMLATLPVSTQRTMLATTRKAVERAGREEQEYRRKLDGYGNLKSKERFVNDVPGGKSHKNRFFAQ